ncbi:MAG: type II secretion system protein GspK [Myxococcota bacterium]
MTPSSPRRRRPFLRRRRRERGAALIMVTTALVVLTVFLVELQEETSVAFSSAVAARARLKAEYNARSGVNLGRLLIAAEPTLRNNIKASPLVLLLGGQRVPQIPLWNFADQLLAPYNCPDQAAEFQNFTGVDLSTAEAIGLGDDGGCFELVMVDENSKLNVNTAARGDVISRLTVARQLMGLMQPPQYADLFNGRDGDDQISTAQQICSAVIDWADYDEDIEPCDLSDQATNAGAEDNFYQSIGLPYLRKNAAFDSLEELRLVRGMSDRFWSTFVDPDPRDPQKRVLTVWGESKLNINSANAQTLYGLACAYAVEGTPMCVDPTQAQQFLSFVTLAKGFTMGAPVFNKGSQFVAMMEGKGAKGELLTGQGFIPVKFQNKRELKNRISTTSKIFSIYAAGVVPNGSRETRVGVHAVIDFRNATEIDQQNPAAQAAAARGGAAAGQAGAATGAAAGANGGSADPTADLMQQLTSNPGGKIIYYRVQ